MFSFSLSPSHTHTHTHTHTHVHSFDEHSLIDLPTMIDFALSISGQEKLYYVGHSQGTMMGFAGFSHDQTLSSKIIAFYPLAPVTTVSHIKGLFSIIARLDKYAEVTGSYVCVCVCVCKINLFITSLTIHFIHSHYWTLLVLVNSFLTKVL